MLAGESFSDHPRSVSRPIASFLRGYNDLLDDRRRVDLYRFAAQTVDTDRTRQRSSEPGSPGCWPGVMSAGAGALPAR